jgi:hypothetical protein
MFYSPTIDFPNEKTEEEYNINKEFSDEWKNGIWMAFIRSDNHSTSTRVSSRMKLLGWTGYCDYIPGYDDGEPHK